jgi:hypothetical protein
MDSPETSATRFKRMLTRNRDLPVRLALATVSASPQFWAGLVLVLPVGALVGSILRFRGGSVAAGLPFVACLFLLWAAQNFVHSTLEIDTATETLTVGKPYGDGTYEPISAATIDAVTFVHAGEVTLIRWRLQGFAVFAPISVCIERTEAVKRQFDQLGLPVSGEPDELARVGSPAWLQAVATPVTLGGVVSAVWLLHSPDAFVSDVVVVPAVVCLLQLVGEALRRRRSVTRPTG